MTNSISWDEYFLTLCFVIATKSKDDSTHVGCVIVDSDNVILSTGFNGLPRGVVEGIPERAVRPDKYLWGECAERNAVYNAARVGISLKGSRLYSLFWMCPWCARAIIQSGISEIVMDKRFNAEQNNGDSEWDKNFVISKQMFKEAGIVVREVEFTAKPLHLFKRGIEKQLN